MYRAIVDRRSTLLMLGVAAALMLILVGISAASVIHFQHESYQAFNRQLGSGQIGAVTFNKKAHTIHVTLADRRHVLVSYPSRQGHALMARLQAKGVPVRIEHHSTKVKAHHTLRYIAGGILIVVILVVLVVLLVGRRRNLAAEAEESSSSSAPPHSG
jgi:ATP-dependent Zn protease